MWADRLPADTRFVARNNLTVGLGVFTLGLPGVAAVVASEASAAELRAILAAAHAPAPDLDWAALGLEAPAAFAADARRRISTAA